MTSKETSLNGKVALITGAARGIGKEIAHALAERSATVIIADYQKELGEVTASNIRNEGYSAAFYHVDLRQESEIQKMIDYSINKFKRIDILVNNAKPRLQVLPYCESLEEWDLGIDVLLKAPALCVKYALPYLRESKGNVINIVSSNAHFISHQPAVYHVAKAGLIQLTRWLACELGPEGIRINAVCPMLVDIKDEGRLLTADPINNSAVQITVPLMRAATPCEIAEVIVFLCSQQAAYITGQVITVDGGGTLRDHFDVARKALLFSHKQNLGDS